MIIASMRMYRTCLFLALWYDERQLTGGLID